MGLGARLCFTLLGVVAGLLTATAVRAEQTVCTITVNSPDERETFRRYLPESKYRFVDLVERGRADWLASACRASVSCDVLIISAHYDGGDVFFPDRLDVSEYLTVTELERASCSGSCPALFARLKEVYLFGCNTLNPAPQSGASAEIVRSLVRDGQSLKEAKQQLQSLNAAHGESGRDRMRHIFKDVPVIYGFSSTAPIGPVAGAVLSRHLRAHGDREIATGRPSKRLLDAFSQYGMTVAPGITDRDPHADARADMCRFADDRSSTATKLAFVHQVLQRHIGEARLHLDRIQRLTASLDERTRATPAVAQALEDIGRDADARARLLDYARDADQPSVRLRLIDLARDVGWLSENERRDELAQMMRELLARSTVGVSEVDLACSLNKDHQLDALFAASGLPAWLNDVPRAAMQACLGSAESRAPTLAGLISPNEADVRAAQTYLRHRPLTDQAELRHIARAVVAMEPGDAQVHALEALARHQVSDREVLQQLTALFARTPSWSVQSAIARILIRADLRALDALQLARELISHRRPAPPAEGDDMIDALIGTLQRP
jgi:hypothetical protein